MLPKTIVTTLTAVPRSSAILLALAVVAGPLAEPAGEDRLDREVELLVRVGREVAARVLPDDGLELLDQRLQVVGIRSVSCAAPLIAALRASRAWSNRSALTSITIRPNIWMNRR